MSDWEYEDLPRMDRAAFDQVLQREFYTQALDAEERDRLWAGWQDCAASASALQGIAYGLEAHNDRLHSRLWFEQLLARSQDRQLLEPSKEDMVALYLSSSPSISLQPRRYRHPQLVGRWTCSAYDSKYGDDPQRLLGELSLGQDGELELIGDDIGSTEELLWCNHHDGERLELWMYKPGALFPARRYIARAQEAELELELIDAKAMVSRWRRQPSGVKAAAKPNVMAEYLFVYDEKRGSFPVRLRILRAGEGATDVVGRDALTGTVEIASLSSQRASLEQTYPKPSYSVSRAWANGWPAVEHNYRGLRDD